MNLLDAAYRLVYAREAEATLFRRGFLTIFHDFERGVYEGHLHASQLGERVGTRVNVDNDEADRTPYLRGGKSDAVGGIHGFVHVLYQFG